MLQRLAEHRLVTEEFLTEGPPSGPLPREHEDQLPSPARMPPTSSNSGSRFPTQERVQAGCQVLGGASQESQAVVMVTAPGTSRVRKIDQRCVGDRWRISVRPGHSLQRLRAPRRQRNHVGWIDSLVGDRPIGG